METKLKILIITSMPWRDDNNIGNSYSNIFRGMEDRFEFAHIYCRSGMPQNSICHRYFQIDESGLIQNIKNRKYRLGKRFFLKDPTDTPMETFSASYDRMRIMRWELFFIARNILWDLAQWKTEELDAFVEDFKPDLIFGTLTYMPNINKMMVYLKKKYHLPLVTYAWDDVYSLKQHSFSPFFWIRRLLQRVEIRKCVRECEYLYTITDLMKTEYARYFNKECRILYKGYDFSGEPNLKNTYGKPIRFVCMGNIGGGRWTTLAKLAEILSKANSSHCKAELLIYTLSPKSEKMLKALNIKGTSKIMKVIPNEKVMDALREADVLVHIEPTDKRDRLLYRLSFSTKLVDYFYAARCILGLGGETASLDYLREKDSGIVVTDMGDLPQVIQNILERPEILREYSQKAWNCGKENHRIEYIQSKLYADFCDVVKKYRSADEAQSTEKREKQ